MATASVRDAARDEAAPPEHEIEVRDAAAPVAARPPMWLALALAGILVVPLFAGLIGYREPTWTPVLDLAQTELRVRDVGTRHTPLVGLPGRIVADGAQGSHPGPLSFYLLAPAYRLFGTNAFALQVGAVVLNAAAILVALLLARRRGRWPLLGMAAGLAVLVTGYGMTALGEPWNPYIPMLWWFVVLVGVWSVLDGDVVALPVVVGASILCAQTHVPYLLLTVGVGGLAVGAAVVQHRRGDAARRRTIVRSAMVSVAVAVVLWIPPLLDELRHDPGNLSILVSYFTHTPGDQPTVGLRHAFSVVASRLDVFHLSLGALGTPGLLINRDPTRAELHRGAAVAVVWMVAALGALRLRNRRLLQLHALVATALVLLVVDASHIYGQVWYYLMLGAWSVAVLMVAAIVWTVVAYLAPRVPPERVGPARTAGAVALVAVTVLFSLRLAWAAPSADHSDPLVTAELSAVVGPTVDALDRGVAPASGRDGRYLVAWDDAAYIGSPGYGLLNELDRRGYHVGAIEGLAAIATPHRVETEADATARIELASGIWIDRWRQVPGATEVATVDPRTQEQRAEFDRLRADVIARLQAAGLDELVPRVDENLFGTAIDQRVPPDVQGELTRMLTLGVPIAVFVAPAGAHA